MKKSFLIFIFSIGIFPAAWASPMSSRFYRCKGEMADETFFFEIYGCGTEGERGYSAQVIFWQKGKERLKTLYSAHCYIEGKNYLSPVTVGFYMVIPTATQKVGARLNLRLGKGKSKKEGVLEYRPQSEGVPDGQVVCLR